MKYRIYGLTAAAAVCVAALAFVLSLPGPQRGPRLIPVPEDEVASYSAKPGEFAGKLGPVVLTNPPQPAPELKFTDDTGREISLADFRGRAVLVNLWATWCVPCVEELPALDRLQAKLGGPQFEVVALSVDREGASVVVPYLEKHEIKSLARYLDNANLATRTFKARGLPTTMLIDAEGREVGRLEGAAQWDTAVAEEYLRRTLLAKSETK